MEDANQFNEIVNQWKSMVVSRLKSAASQFSHGKPKGMIQRKGRSEDKLRNSIRSKTWLNYGQAEGVSFQLERHGVFVHKGVGRGYKMTNGLVVKYSKNTKGSRQKKEWFNPILENLTPQLADKLGTLKADTAVKAAMIK